MKWQQSWMHAEAYGFRTGRSAEDAAALLQALLELARATGRSMSGAGLDYKKCFDLVPQRIALRLAQEFGMALGALRAARGMYRQLRRAFKVLGCLGDWGQATNGILQGCLLSVVFINMLTTVWKREIDELRVGFRVQVRDLPPRREEMAEPARAGPLLSVPATPPVQPGGWASGMGGPCPVYPVYPRSPVTPVYPGSPGD